MSDILSAIYDDIQEYERLCRKYGEKVHMSRPTRHDQISTPDCYGDHAKKLEERERKENRIREAALSKLTDKEKRILGL